MINMSKAETIEVKVRTENSGGDFFYVSKGNTRLGYTKIIINGHDSKE